MLSPNKEDPNNLFTFPLDVSLSSFTKLEIVGFPYYKSVQSKIIRYWKYWISEVNINDDNHIKIKNKRSGSGGNFFEHKHWSVIQKQ